MKFIHFAFSFVISLTVLISPLYGLDPVPGDQNFQEKGDIEFRQLQALIDEHSGIYWVYGSGDPADKNNHLMVELDGSSGFRTISVQSFVDTFGSYFGAYTVKDTNLTKSVRDAIIQTTFAIRQRNPAVLYVDDPTVQYIEWTDGAGIRAPDGILQEDEINQMRSDAYVEYCYAANGFPIIKTGLQDKNIINGTDDLRLLAQTIPSNLLPSDQRKLLRASVVENPTIEIRNAADNSLIVDGSTANAQEVTVKVYDPSSGPGRLEIWQGNPPQTGSLLGANDIDFDPDEHTYTSSDLSALANLSEGQFTVRAFDQAGNDTSQAFTIDRTPPTILEVKDTEDKIISHWDDTFDRTIIVSVTSDTSKIILEGFTPEGHKTDPLPVSGTGGPIITEIFRNLIPASLYRILAYDQVGNKSEHPFYVLVTDSEGTGEHAFNHSIASQTQVNDAGNPVSHIRTGPFYIGPNVSTSALITISMEAMATSTLTAAEVPCKYNISNNNYFDPGVYYTEVATPEGVVDFNTPVLESIGGNMPFTNTAPNTAPERRKTTFDFPVGDLLPVENSTAVPVFSFYYRVRPNITLVPTVFLSSCSLFVPISIEIDKIQITFPTSPGSGNIVPASSETLATSENGEISVLMNVDKKGNIDFNSSSIDSQVQIVSGGNTENGMLKPFASNIFDITTTAEYSGNTQVRINYSNAQVSQEDEPDLKILKLDGGGGPLAEDITVSIDTAKKVITGIISTTDSTIGRFGIGLVDITTPTVSVVINPQSPVSSGTVDVTLTASEPLSLSVLSYSISGGTATNVPLVSVDSVTFTGSFTVDQSMNGLAQWTWNGEDLAGNAGAEITSGATFFIDTIPPSAVTDLKVISFSTSSIDLAWTSPQDTGTLGSVVSYDLRFSTAKIVTDSDFQSAGVITTTSPQTAGSLESITVTGLVASTSHFFSIRSLDNAGNVSEISNLAFVDPTPPVTEIFVSLSSFTFNGDVYISSSSFLILQSTDIAVVGHPSGVAEIKYTIDGSTPIVYTAPFNLTGGSHTVSFQGIDLLGNVEPLQTAVFFVDQAPPVTSINSGAFFSDGADLFAQPGQTFVLESVDPRGIEIAEFSDDFSSDLSQWQTLFGTWFSTSGVLKNSDSASLKTVRQDFSSDRTVSLKAKTLIIGSDTWHVTWIYPKYEDTNNYVLFVLHQTGNLELNVMKDAVMDRYDIATGLDPLVEHQYRAVIQGQNIQIFIDGIQYADVINSNVPQIAGGIAVRGEASLIQADDVVVKRIAPSSASGVKNIFARLDEGLEFIFSSSITINGEGVHNLSFHSDDNVGNIEVEKNQTIRLDDTPPQSRLLYGTPLVSVGTNTFISPETILNILSIDSEVNGVASGIEDIGMTVDGSSIPLTVIPSSYSAVTSTFTLSGGEHLLVFLSTDNVGNREVEQSSMVTVDADAPIVLISSPAGGDRFIALKDTFEVRFDVSDNYDLSPSSDAFLSHVSSTHTLSVSDGQIIDPQLLLSGFWTLTVNTTDFVGNSVSVQTSGFEVVRDTLSPLSRLELGGAQFVLARSTYITSGTQLTIGTTDDLAITGDRLGLGASETLFAVNLSSFSVYPGSFTLSQEGVNTVRFFSEDIAGNVEPVQVSTFLADNSAPQTTLTIGDPQVVLNSSRIINSESLITLLTQDILSNGVASGVGDLEVSVDGASFIVNGSTSFALGGGTHTFSYFGSDNVGNSEVSQLTSVTVDVEPPIITVTSPLNGSKFVAGSDTFKIDFNVIDNYDPSPSSTAFLTLGFSAVVVTDGDTIDPSSLSAGLWTLTVSATDFVDNAISSPIAGFEVVFDTLAPRSNLQLSGVQFNSNGSLYITTQTTIALSSFDDLIVTEDNVGLGVDEIRFSIDSSTSFALYSAPFTIAEGSRTVRFFSKDIAGNTELVQSTTLLVDVTPPLTSITIGNPMALADGEVFIGPSADISLQSQDVLSNAVESGINQLDFGIDGNSFVVLESTSFNLSGGTHSINYFGTDNVGNIELELTTSVIVDASAPVITISSPIAGSVFALQSDTITIFFNVTDNFDSSPSSSAYLSLQSSTVTVPVSHGQEINPLTLPAGLWTLTVSATDFVNNNASSNSGTFEIVHDEQPPRTLININGTQFSLAGSTYITNLTSLILSTTDDLLLAGDSAGLGVSEIKFAIDSSTSFTVYSVPFTLSEGTHTVRYFAEDVAGNLEIEKSIALLVDDSDPVTTVNIGDPKVIAGNEVKVSTSSQVSLNAIDPLNNGVESGVSLTQYRIDGGSFITYSGPFTLSGGSRTIDFQSQDNLNHLEVIQSTTVIVDGIAPNAVTDLNILNLTPDSITLSWTSPGDDGETGTATSYDLRLALSNILSEADFASATKVLSVPLPSVSGSQETVTLTGLAPNTAYFFAVKSADQVENVSGISNVASAATDATAPLSQLAVQGNNAVLSTSLVVNSNSLLSINSNDPLVNGIASGVEEIHVTVDGSSPTIEVNGSTSTGFSTAVNLTAGNHSLSFFAVDRIGNTETLKSTSVIVDASAPVITISSPAAGSVFSLQSDTITIFFNVTDNFDSSPSSSAYLSLQSSTVTVPVSHGQEINPLTLPSGLWTLTVSATDFVDNNAVANSGTFEVLHDEQPPRTDITLSGTQFSLSGSTYITSLTSLILSATDDLLIAGDNAGLGVSKIKFAIDSSTSFTVYSVPFTLSEGTHTVRYFAEDVAGNIETEQGITLFVDDTPPVTTMDIGDPKVVNGSETKISTSSQISLSAVDPLSNGTGSGVLLTQYKIDGGSFITYSDPFTLSGGSHTIDFQSQDNLNHLEVIRSTSIIVDNVPPATVTISISSGSGSGEVILSWTAPGDDGTIGQADSYEVRYLTEAINDANFSQAIARGQGIVPQVSGSQESFTVTGLVGGTEYFFALKSFDAIGNVSAISNVVSTIAVVLDSTAPIVNITFPIDGSTLTTNVPAVTMVYSDADSGINLSNIQVLLDSNDVTNQTAISSNSAVFTPASAISEGAHNISVTVFDNAGNSASASSSFTIDTLPPSIQIALAPPSPVNAGTVNVTVTASEILQTIQLSFTPEAQSPINVPLSSSDNVTFTGSFSVDTSMDGTAQFTWSGTDLAGLSGNTITTGGSFVIDTVAPTASISISPVSPVPAGTVNVTIISDEPLQSVSLNYTLEGGSPITVPVSGGGSNWAGTFNIVPNSGDGSAQFNWTGVDIAGNTGNTLSGTTIFEIDTTAPIGNLKINNDASYTTSSIVTVSFQAADFTSGGRVAPANLLLSLDGGSIYNEEPFIESKQVTLPAGGFVLPNGQGVFKRIFVKFRDAAGNESAAVKNGIVLDTSGPPKSVILIRKK